MMLQKLLTLPARLFDPAVLHELVFRPIRRLPMVRRVDVTADAGVSVVLVTNRPHRIEHAIASFDAQHTERKELVLVTNGDGFDEARMSELCRRPDVRCIRTPAHLSLGAALNLGVGAADFDVIAKFDDDDHYGPDYLGDGVDCMRSTGAAVVGKKTYYLYLESADRTVLMYPGNESKRVGRVAGGTIMAHRRVFDHVGFPQVDLGEDVRFVRAVERCGYGVYSARARGFLQRRAATGHTWAFDAAEITAVSDDVGPGEAMALWC